MACRVAPSVALSVLRKAHGQNCSDLTQSRDEIWHIYAALDAAGQFNPQLDTMGIRQVDQLYWDQTSNATAWTKVLAPVLPM